MASGDFPAQRADGPGASRWGRAGEDGPGGGATDEKGNLNFDRFSEPVVVDLELRWWNKKKIWEVAGEPTGHEVLVVAGTVNVWRVHAMVAGAIVAIGVLGLILFGGLSPLLGLAVAVVLGLICLAALMYEQRASSVLSGAEEVYSFDRTVWEMMVMQCREAVLTKTKSGQEDLYDAAVQMYQKRHDDKYQDPDTGKVGKHWANPKTGRVEPVPKFEVPARIKAEFLNEGERITNEVAATQIERVLSQEERGRTALRKRYQAQPKAAEGKGRGVRGCSCVACEVNAANGVVPRLSGAEAYREALRIKESKARIAREAGEMLGDATPLSKAAAKRITTMESGRAARSKAMEKSSPVPTEVVDRRRGASATAAAAESMRSVETTASEAPSSVSIEEVDPKAVLRQPMGKSSKRRPAVLIGVGVAVVAILAGLGSMLVLGGGQDEPKSGITLPEETVSQSAQPSTTTPTTSAKPPTAGEVAGKAIEFAGTDPGNQESGAGVIAAYDHAYYVTRSAVDAQAVYAQGARGDARTLQQSIDANPTGTKHSLKVTPVVPGQEYDVELTIMWPNVAPFVTKQKFFTTYVDGKFYILRSEQL